jgi:ATP-dependent Clp protease ATP-binding subunit ClpA
MRPEARTVPKDKKLIPFPDDSGDCRDYASEMRSRLIGQDDSIDAIVPYLEIFDSQLSPPARPAGVFLLLGPTGTGKTRTVEVLAEVLHGSAQKLLRIDCGEFQLEHETAKLIGAPPGYVGHRETSPMINQQKVNAMSSEMSELSLVLFDEIEKASPSLLRLLLGVLDKGELRLGDGGAVNFQRCLVFMTSNVGAEEMMRRLRGRLGFEGAVTDGEAVRQIGRTALKRAFPPEFVNRIDRVLAYRPLNEAMMEQILDLELMRLCAHLECRLGPDAPELEFSADARAALLKEGVTPEFGARELKRVIHQRVLHPIALHLRRTKEARARRLRVAGPLKNGSLELRPAA